MRQKYLFLIKVLTPLDDSDEGVEVGCTCHERDGSYTCDHCKSQGLYGHMEKIAARKAEPWNCPNEHGESAGGQCCQRAVGGRCFEHTKDNWYLNKKGTQWNWRLGLRLRSPPVDLNS